MSLRGLPIMVSALVVLWTQAAVGGPSSRSADSFKLAPPTPFHAPDVCAGGGGGSGGSSGAATVRSAASSVGATASTPGASTASIGAAGNPVSITHFGTADGTGTAAIGGASGANAAAAGASPGGGGDNRSAAALWRRADRPCSLRAVYFRRDLYKGTADCLTAAHAQQLPLEVCQ
jgi:hypothetical protein